MNILIVGKGGREHALAWKCRQNPQVKDIFVAPGSKGMTEVATPVEISETDVESLVAFAQKKSIDLTIVGPETSLEKGIANAFRAKGLRIFAPTREASQIEWSKDFCKRLMQKYHIPSASYQTFRDLDSATAYLQTQSAPYVLKEDGLRAGKGVSIVFTKEEALQVLQKAFAQKDNQVLIEEYLEGFEYSLIALVHHHIVIPFDVAQDHKKVGEEDTGPNTGGMGAYSPVSKITPHLLDETIRKVLQPMADALCEEGIPFTGFLYGGLMLTSKGIYTIEFNARFGDPEAEVLLPRLQSDLVEVINNLLTHNQKSTLVFDPQAYVGVVLASEGYPQSETPNSPIVGLEKLTSALVFHMGTDNQDHQWVSRGGRVLCVVEKDLSLSKARAKLYDQLSLIHAPKLFYRKDIGSKDLPY